MNSTLRVSREETSLRERATQTLRTAILEGVFAPGQKLSERVLCESLGVSRSCVRETLQHLQAEGLITVVPHRGPEVTSISAAEVRHIYEVRASLEALAVKGFVDNATPAQLAALRTKVSELAQASEAGQDNRLLVIKNQFYDILLEGCGNPVAGQLLRQLNNRVTVLRRVSMAQPGRLPRTIEELDTLVAAMERGDGDAAAALCVAHIRNAAANVLRSMAPERQHDAVDAPA